MMPATAEVVDDARIGKKGFPRHYKAFGLEPPKKSVPIVDNLPDHSSPPLETLEIFRQEIQALLDKTAKSRRYENGNSMASYVLSTNAIWAAEAKSFVAWRDSVWLHAYAELEKVMSGDRVQPTVKEFIAELPTIEWPPS